MNTFLRALCNSRESYTHPDDKFPVSQLKSQTETVGDKIKALSRKTGMSRAEREPKGLSAGPLQVLTEGNRGPNLGHGVPSFIRPRRKPSGRQGEAGTAWGWDLPMIPVLSLGKSFRPWHFLPGWVELCNQVIFGTSIGPGYPPLQHPPFTICPLQSNSGIRLPDASPGPACRRAT